MERFAALESLMTVELCRENALRFSEEMFRRAIRDVVDAALLDTTGPGVTQLTGGAGG
ncbi:hypothetical protein GDI2488 [Gluconacetobacter diazotrophicus PA1 5]|uniref:Uncharacterized protein n=1 Tax=Gluconacetobacter diazotrophicus (strain ATCC 49037 / DSM 5601 / CCUG 37298 / CIP 103539 / LMG 7603 / PAl5) TaxID=272568 RepID=A9HNE1_GLUDA|nr:hypothetical protein GDI2488 [Gluconacetobacter diazotrophicus PA1 5]